MAVFAAALALVLVSGPMVAPQSGNPPQSLLQRIVPKPTGRNGYEEYLAAADVLTKPEVRRLAAFVFGSDPSVTPLAAKRAWVAAAAKALALVRAGNAKPIFDPRDKYSVSTLLPEYVEFRSLARLFAAEARVRFADGEPAAATQALLDALTFADRMGHYTLIATLVSHASIGILLGEIEADLGVLSQKDALALAKAADSLLNRETNMVDALKTESQFWASGLDELLANPTELINQIDGDGDDAARYQKEAESLTAADKSRLAAKISAMMQSRLDAAVAVLRGPEKGWVQEPPADDFGNDLEGAILRGMAPSYTGAMSAVARVRTQLRLLRLHGAIIAYLWENDRLPIKLEDLEAPALIDDPATGKTFHYKVIGPASYRLWSDGWGKVGRIEMKYTRGGEDTSTPNP